MEISGDDALKIGQAIGALLDKFVAAFGPIGTVGIVFALIVVSFLYRMYCDWRKDRDTSLALAEKERTIQRLASENREYRIAMFKEKYGWTDEEIDLFVTQGEFRDGAEARKTLEKKKVKELEASKKRPKPSGRGNDGGKDDED